MVIKNNYDYIDAQRAKKATKIVVEYCQFFVTVCFHVHRWARRSIHCLNSFLAEY